MMLWTPTIRFFVFTLIGTLVAATIISLSRSKTASQRVARGFFILATSLRIALLVITILTISLISDTSYGTLVKLLAFPGSLVIGAALASVAFVLWESIRGAEHKHNTLRNWLTSAYLLKGLRIYVALAFVAADIGKLSRLPQMRQFFHGSGYGDWFLYSIIGAETLGAIGLLIRKFQLAATCLLATIMVGAIWTHYRNGDDFADSLSALHLLIVCLCMLLLANYQKSRASNEDG